MLESYLLTHFLKTIKPNKLNKMKQTATTIITWIAYVLEWQKTNKQKIIGARDLFAHDTKFILFLRACFMWNERANGSTCVWLDTAGREPMTKEQQNEFILPLMKLTSSELNDLCRFAEIAPEEVAKFVGRLNVGE